MTVNKIIYTGMKQTEINVPINEQEDANVASLLELIQYVIATVAGGTAHINVVAATVLNVTLIPGIKLIKYKNAKFKIGAARTLMNEKIQTSLSFAASLNDTLPNVQPIAIHTSGEDKLPNVLIV
jgi:hypothetical protein